MILVCFCAGSQHEISLFNEGNLQSAQKIKKKIENKREFRYEVEIHTKCSKSNMFNYVGHYYGLGDCVNKSFLSELFFCLFVSK